MATFASSSNFFGTKNVVNNIFWNVQGLTNKIDYLSLIGKQNDLNIISVAEHWVNNEDMSSLFVPGYVTASYYCRPTRLHGGTAIFVRNEVVYKELAHISKLSVEMVCEVSAIELLDYNLIILSLYRPFNEDSKVFQNSFTALMTFSL